MCSLLYSVVLSCVHTTTWERHAKGWLPVNDHIITGTGVRHGVCTAIHRQLLHFCMHDSMVIKTKPRTRHLQLYNGLWSSLTYPLCVHAYAWHGMTASFWLVSYKACDHHVVCIECLSILYVCNMRVLNVQCTVFCMSMCVSTISLCVLGLCFVNHLNGVIRLLLRGHSLVGLQISMVSALSY